MNKVLNHHQLRRVLLGVTCLLLAPLVVACSPQSQPPAATSTTPPVASDEGLNTGAGEQPAAAPAESPAQEPSSAASPSEPTPLKPTAEDNSLGSMQVTSCGGEETVTVSKDLTGQVLADVLMDQWKRDYPERDWVTEEKQKHVVKPPADNAELLQGEQEKGHVYGNYSTRDVLTWSRETEKFVAEGSRIFHDAKELGSTVAVSCDMCHPHAANTHPETYPKFQVQLGRVALLRDMINWCVQNPVRAEPLDPDGPKMRALEAYIMAQRSGTPMQYGRH